MTDEAKTDKVWGIVANLVVHPSSLAVYEGIGPVERSEEDSDGFPYSVEFSYDNGIFRLWVGEDIDGSLRYIKFGESEKIATFRVSDFREDGDKYTNAEHLYVSPENNIDQAKLDFLASVAERVKNNLK